jgi:uncharacterized protein (TIGR02284 family)
VERLTVLDDDQRVAMVDDLATVGRDRPSRRTLTRRGESGGERFRDRVPGARLCHPAVTSSAARDVIGDPVTASTDRRTAMSTDQKITDDLVETLRDGEQGYAHAADRLRDGENSALADRFLNFSRDRARYAEELRAMAASYGDHVDDSGSVAASFHRTWISLKDALTGSDPAAIAKAAIEGENHAVDEYERALDADISAGLRATVAHQLARIRAARAELELIVAG